MSIRPFLDRVYFLSSLYLVYVIILNILMIFGIVFLFHKRVIERDFKEIWAIEFIIPLMLLIDLLFISYVTKCP
jgi:hypothetical protein